MRASSDPTGMNEPFRSSCHAEILMRDGASGRPVVLRSRLKSLETFSGVFALPIPRG
jgi:hypothetical protein